MPKPVYKFTSELQRISDFLYESGHDHSDVIYMNFTTDTGIYEDRKSGSYIYLEFSNNQKILISTIHFCLVGVEGIVHDWARMFQNVFGAAVEELD